MTCEKCTCQECKPCSECDEMREAVNAFPSESFCETCDTTWHLSGMTLLDYFAGQALMGLYSEFGFPSDEKQRRNRATEAYDIAAAMLAEKKKREGVST